MGASPSMLLRLLFVPDKMSKLKLPNDDDYPDAAGKHLDDSIALFDADRYDGAGYLAGYVLECSFKAVVMLEERGGLPSIPPLPVRVRSMKHDIDKLSSEALRLAVATSKHASQYMPNVKKTNPVYTQWSEVIRYRSPSFVSDTMALEWIDEATNVYTSTVAKMRLMGVV